MKSSDQECACYINLDAWFGSLAILIWILLCMFENAKLQKGQGKQKFSKKKFVLRKCLVA